MKRLFRNIMVLAAVAMAAVACQTDDLIGENPQPQSDQISIRFGVVSPDMRQVNTRAVDPDGKGIQNITLFCFDAGGLFISTATAHIEADPGIDEISLSGGIFDALIPQSTRIMHLVANQNMSTFTEDTFRYKNENEVMSILEGSSGMMIYWARVEVPTYLVENAEDPSTEIKTWLEAVTNDNPIIMLRNQAKVSVKSDGDHFVVNGFAVENTQAFGTVAPFHQLYYFPSYAHQAVQAANKNYPAYIPQFYVSHKDDDETFKGLATDGQKHWHAEDFHFITLPENRSKLTNVHEVVDDAEIFVFESENSSGDPVNVIIQGHNKGETEDKYYRVTLTDADGEQVLVERNHHYKIVIGGKLSFGQESFAEALTAPPTNNIWLSISDEVNEVQDQTSLLRVNQTSAVVRVDVNGDAETFAKPASETATWELNGNQLKLGFQVEDSEGISRDKLSITWLDVDGQYQNVSSTTDLASAISFDNGTGTITLTLNKLSGAIKKEGTILVKYGHLQRKIKVVSILQQKFQPIWVSTQVYGTYNPDGNESTSTKEGRANVTLMFNVPETCPDELLPFEVMLSVNVLDVRSESGQTLPVIRADDPRYGDIVDRNGDGVDDIGYKYVYTVKQKGTQRIYLESILNQENGSSDRLKIESAYFSPEEKVFTFTNVSRSIRLTNAKQTNEGADESQNIYYLLVPQKAGAPVVLNLELKNGDQTVDAGQYDEFLLYSENLDHYEDSDLEKENVYKALSATGDVWMTDYFSGTDPYLPCQFAPVDQNSWGSGGRVFAFIQRPKFYLHTTFTDSRINKGHFSVYMQTNKAKCAEVVRVSSNQPEGKAAFTKTYSGDTNNRKTIYNPNSEANNLYSYINDPTADKNYKGKSDAVFSYRSFVFELANYRPYRFEASVTGVVNGENIDHDTESSEPEQIDNALWSYLPNQDINVEFDITDFKANDDKLVDPFGREFEIYIHAPMLELHPTANKVPASKLYYDSAKECFVYKVVSTQTDERSEASNAGISGQTKHDDTSRAKADRKILKFRTKDIVSEGKITISSNESKVVYLSKTFNIQNAPISGKITYSESADGAKNALDDKSFVSFTRIINGSRIGSIDVSKPEGATESTFELRLRQEYDFSWVNDKVQLYYAKSERVGDDKVTKYYTATYASLDALYKAMASGDPVNLVYEDQLQESINTLMIQN